MSDQKSYSFRPPLYDYDRDAVTADKLSRGSDKPSSRTAEQQGWDAYRKWLSRVGARPVRERSTIDHTLYSWKGYNSWADRIKQTWKPEDKES